jgi:hypothetical protein
MDRDPFERLWRKLRDQVWKAQYVYEEEYQSLMKDYAEARNVCRAAEARGETFETWEKMLEKRLDNECYLHAEHIRVKLLRKLAGLYKHHQQLLFDLTTHLFETEVVSQVDSIHYEVFKERVPGYNYCSSYGDDLITKLEKSAQSVEEDALQKREKRHFKAIY